MITCAYARESRSDCYLSNIGLLIGVPRCFAFLLVSFCAVGNCQCVPPTVQLLRRLLLKYRQAPLPGTQRTDCGAHSKMSMKTIHVTSQQLSQFYRIADPSKMDEIPSILSLYSPDELIWGLKRLILGPRGPC